METQMIKLVAYAQTAMRRMKEGAKRFAQEEAGGSEIIAVVAVAAVAVLLAFAFQNEVSTFIHDTVEHFTTQITGRS